VALAHYEIADPKGEFTVVIHGAVDQGPIVTETALKEELQRLLAAGLTRSEASRQLAQATGQSRKVVYQLSLALDSQPTD
jgi:16S rRNA (cytidine1402-2'-O)-methyltransferase